PLRLAVGHRRVHERGVGWNRGTAMSQLYELSRPFPAGLVKQKPGKFAASYVEHSVISQRLLEVVGPHDFAIDRVVTNPDGVVSGCTATLTVEVDGRRVAVTEVGDVEHPGANNGANLKNAASDALKRCAMRLGVGLHLWSQDNYYLDKALEKREQSDG
ncbi:MAG TPA: Rad52/Rad22 family DNA repair protein, partial [Acidimicrobiia bacterium]